jgi:hypothetical protein
MDPQKNPQNGPAPGSPQPPNTPPADTDLGLADEGAAKPEVGSTVSPQSSPPEAPNHWSAPQPSTTPDAPTPMPPTPSDMNLPPAAPSARMPKKKRMGMMALIIGGVLALLLGAGAAAYFGYYLPKQPDNVLKAALVNSFSKDTVESVAFEGEVKSQETTGEERAISGTFTGAVDHEGKFDMSMKLDVFITNLTLDMRSVDGKTFYVRVGGLEGLPELLSASGDPTAQMYGPLLDSINNQWYEINESLINEYTNMGFELGSLTEQDLQKIASAYEQHPFFVVKETLADENIKGTDSYHYKVVVDEDKLEAFVKALKDANLDGLKLDQQNLDDFSNMLNSVDFSKHPFDVWIAKDTKLFTQFMYSMTEDDATLTMRLTITDYNKPVEVEKPEDAKSILEVLSNYFLTTGGTLEDMQSGLPEGFELHGESSGGTGISL